MSHQIIPNELAFESLVYSNRLIGFNKYLLGNANPSVGFHRQGCVLPNSTLAWFVKGCLVPSTHLTGLQLKPFALNVSPCLYPSLSWYGTRLTSCPLPLVAKKLATTFSLTWLDFSKHSVPCDSLNAQPQIAIPPSFRRNHMTTFNTCSNMESTVVV